MTKYNLIPLSLATFIAAAGAPCPAPSVQHAGQCVLQADVILTDTLWIPSGTNFNCQGHRITPSATGVLDDPRTTANAFQPSRPELALFVDQAQNVTIQNCVVSGFDFGIIVAQSKNTSVNRNVQIVNKILANTIDVRTNPIDVINSDDVLISGNRVTYASERGRGIIVDFDS